MVEIERIRELVTMMAEHELTEVELRDGEQCVVLKRGSGVVASIAPPSVTVTAAPVAAAVPSPAATEARPDESLLTIRSPMVGTFYASPAPDTAAFVTVGSQVEPDTVVCIIEAMKVFNEIKAEVAGTIEQVLVRNEQPLEYGQPMFLVRPRA